MKKNTDPLQPNTYDHIYNRGINGETVYKEESNYAYFLNKYAKYIEPVADTYAYCLLKNHFHFLVLTKDEKEIANNVGTNVDDVLWNIPSLSIIYSNQIR